MRIKHWQNRALFLSSGIILCIVAIIMIAKVFNDNIVYFYSPSDLISKKIEPSSKTMRVGGLVVDGSIKKLDDITIEFEISDLDKTLKIQYKGIPPMLFREGQGTVATGVLKENNLFIAKEILAKHDENYMPKEVADSLKKSGHWKE
mgnify:CR=1 FL=1